MQIFCKKCKKHTSNTFPKKLVPISKNIIKEKSKCAICLTEKTCIHKIENKYDLKSKVKVYPKLFTDHVIKKNVDLLRKV